MNNYEDLTDEQISVKFNDYRFYLKKNNRYTSYQDFVEGIRSGKYNPKEYYDALVLPSKSNTNIPKCPTCQSSNIKSISFGSRVVFGASFGLFSKTAKSQFHCKNCGYKW